MIIILVALLFLVFLIIILFSFPQFSPIPYFPTNNEDLPIIIKTFRMKNNLVLFDLGAGDGTVIFAAASLALAEKLNTRFVAVEINPVLVLIMKIRRLFHPNKNNIKIIFSDLFKLDFSRFTLHASSFTFYLYVSPKFLEKIYLFVKESLPKASIVSYMYPIKSAKNSFSKIKGKNFIYRYN